MHPLERCCVRVRYHPWLRKAGWLWNVARPCYEWALGLMAANGLERTMNGTDTLFIHRKFHSMGEIYEPLVWERLMAQAREGDVTVDVGAFIGLYTIALAKRVGPSGKAIAFEPNPQTFEELKRHVELNGVGHQVKLIPAAVSNHKGRVLFDVLKKSEAHIAEGVGVKTLWVETVTLDEMFAHSKVDLLKIDVEGHEEKVLEGGKNLLQDPSRCPRAIYVEIHPYAWPALGTTSESLLGLLNRCSYRVLGMDEKLLKRIESWGEIFAYKEG